ncbi:MAG TPA: ROK family transcriptional regulator [Candidatus Lumbricidophila sp.]|nr:ROK family transcriptional regulator [Candidatus Lumbricidophila sp.]
MSDRALGVEQVRRDNLARVLRIVHENGPQSRSELTRATGLNRSTIGTLAADLAELQLVEVREPVLTRRVGRPSPMVAPTDRTVVLAVNPEVDATELAFVGLDLTMHHHIRVEHTRPPTPAETVALISDTCDSLASDLPGRRLIGIGVAVPGLVRAADGFVRDAPHLGWVEVPLQQLVASATGHPVVVGNDANLGAIAEHVFGAARGHDHVVYLNGGASGIGGGLIVHGMPVGGASGYAGEFGHNRAVDGEVLETTVSRTRLLETLGLASASDAVLAAALAGTTAPEVLAEIDRQRQVLAASLANVANVLDPSVIVLGGFLAMLAERAPEDFTAVVAEHVMAPNAEDLRITSAVLAERRLLVGAAEAAFAEVLADPLGVSLTPGALPTA